MSQVSRTIAKTYFETGDYPTQSEFSDFIDSAKWYDDLALSNVDQLFALFGSTMKAETLCTNVFQAVSSFTLVDQVIRFTPVIVKVAADITNVRWGQVAAGSYTGNNENRVGIYSIDASTGLLTLIASTANDTELWKATTGTVGSKALSSTWSAAAGIYFVGSLYCRSAVVTAPTISAGSNVAIPAFVETGFTGSNKLAMFLAAQTSLPLSVNMSALTRSGNPVYFQFY